MSNTRTWLPAGWEKTIVHIERLIKDDKGNDIFLPAGTGFVTEFETFNILVTCKHVIYDIHTNKYAPGIFISFNQKDGSLARRSLEDIQKAFQLDWTFHQDPTVDLAVIPFAIDFTRDDIKRAGKDLFEAFERLTEGEDIFFLGYPALDIKMEKHIKPIVRSGIISLVMTNKTFLIDANVFPGNSGSPVFLKPSFMHYQGSKVDTVNPAKFIGIISAYLSYRDTALSQQTGRPRITFEENSGLANVYSGSIIEEIFNSADFVTKVNELKKRIQK